MISRVLFICLWLMAAPSSVLAFQEPDPEPVPRSGLAQIPRDLARNSLHLFSTNNVAPLIIGGLATAATHTADDSVLNQFATGHRLSPAGKFAGRQLGSGPVVMASVGGLWTLSRFRGSAKFAQFSDDLLQASALNSLVTLGLKESVRRTRPDGSNRRSFPSGPTSSAFAVATVVSHHYGLKSSIAAYTLAGLVGVSRIDARKHYLSDVVAGATTGYIVARTVTRHTQLGRTVQWMPIVEPSTKTAGIAFFWSPGRD